MFDELKIKSILKKELTSDKYLKLSYKIKTDPRVVEHFLKCDPNNITFLGNETALKLVLENYDLVNYLDKSQLNTLFKKLDISKIELSKELFSKLDIVSRDLVFEKLPITYFGLVDFSLKQEKIESIIIGFSYGEEFDTELLDRIILSFSADDISSLFSGSKKVSDYVTKLLSTLSLESAIELYSNCNKLYEHLPKEIGSHIDIINADGNLDKIVELDNDTQVKYFLEHMEDLRYASEEVIIECLVTRGNITCDELVNLDLFYDRKFIRNHLSSKELEKVFEHDFEMIYWCCNFDYGQSLDFNKLMLDRIAKIPDKEKSEKLKSLYLTLTDEPAFPKTTYIYANERYQFSRLLYDDNIVSNNSYELLEQYRNTFDRELLIQILTNAYGEHVKKIFESRPNLDLLDIDNFKIFDKDIYDKLGKGFVDYVLNSKMFNLNYLISEMSLNPEILDNFKDYFDCMTSDYEKIDINIISNLMSKFLLFKDIIKDIDFDNITEERKRNLRLITTDMEEVSICIHSLEDLDNYRELRKKRYVEISENLNSVEDVKNLIFSYVSGRSVIQEDEDLVENLSLKKAIKAFNIDKIIKDDAIIREMGLSNDDVAMLLLLHEISRVSDVSTLKNTFISLVNRELDALTLSSTLDKIKSYYVEDIKSSVLSNSSLDNMPKEVIDGVEVVNFEGEPFTLLCSVIGLNLSEGKVYTSMYGHDLLSDWLNREGGLTTISTALCSSDTEIYPVAQFDWEFFSKNIIFVFDGNIDIIGMGGSDISSSHRLKSKRHSFGFMDYNEFGFSTMKELKKTINSTKKRSSENGKFHSEITIARKEEDIRKEDGGYKRAMPIGLYVVGDIRPEDIETAKVFSTYYEENGLGKFRIIRVNPKVYKGEGQIVTTPKNDDEIGFSK